MKNRYLRLFVAQTKLMTAEKMRLDRFCQPGEYFAYKIALPPDAELNPERIGDAVDVKFIFDVDLDDQQYFFTNDNITEEMFTTFELHLSSFLNELFHRKTEFEKRNKEFEAVTAKLFAGLTEEERRCLATNIDINATTVLKALGAIVE